ncbi:hypothetical protein L0337_43540 [candidate division KSB1 bacterium]|nr:hypothetical protein [candidate division KSB1 bacterium]
MKLAGAVGKSGVLVLVGAFIAWFLSDLLSLPASGNLFEKLILTTPVVLAIRVSLIFVAFSIAGFIIVIFWKQIGILKIGSSGIEFGKFAETSSKADAELAAKDVIIRDLEAKVESLKKSVQKLSKVTDPKSKG